MTEDTAGKLTKKGYILFYAALIIASLTLGFISLGKGFRFDIFPRFEGDAFSFMTLIQGVDEHGIMGIFHIDRLGAPDGASQYDTPSMGFSSYLLVYIISLFSDCTPTIAYGFYLISFAIDAVAMGILLMKLKAGYLPAFTMSILFAIAPYHFLRDFIMGWGHGALIDYACIPIAVYLGLYIAGCFDEKKSVLIPMTIYLGLGFGYYYVFGLMLFATAYLILFLEKSFRELLGKLWVMIATILAVAATLLPRIVMGLIKGKNTEAMIRAWNEQERYGLKIIQLLVPPDYSRNSLLKYLADAYNNNALNINENATACLGLVGAVGFLLLCVSLILILFKKAEPAEDRVIRVLAIFNMVAVTVGAIGGFGEIFNMFVTPQVRCYNRISILIAALSCTMIALLLKKADDRFGRKAIPLVAVVLIVGIYDQLYIPTEAPQQGMAEQQEINERFFSAVEDMLPEAAMVYQLPYVDYPETFALVGYEMFDGYFFTDYLRWSFGGIKGRDTTARQLNRDEGMSYYFLDGIKKAGFSAVYINRKGFTDGGAHVLAFYDDLGLPHIVSENGEEVVYDITGLEIPEEYITPGYYVIQKILEERQIDVPGEEILAVAKGIGEKDSASGDCLFEWIDGEELSDREYISMLYEELMYYEIGESMLDYFEANIETNGLTRRMILDYVLYEQGFLTLHGYQ